MEASRWSDGLETVRYLLAKGAAPKARDEKGVSAWTYAMLEAHNDTAQALEKAGAPPEYESLSWEGIFHPAGKAMAVVVTEQAAWEALWKELGRDPEIPAIDFKTHVAAAVSQERLSGPESFNITFLEPALSGDTLTLGYSMSPTIIYDAGSTSPYALKIFKRAGAKRFAIPPVSRGSRPRDWR